MPADTPSHEERMRELRDEFHRARFRSSATRRWEVFDRALAYADELHAELDRVRTFIDERYGMQPVTPDGELVSLLYRLESERGARAAAILDEVCADLQSEREARRRAEQRLALKAGVSTAEELAAERETLAGYDFEKEAPSGEAKECPGCGGSGKRPEADRLFVYGVGCPHCGGTATDRGTGRVPAKEGG